MFNSLYLRRNTLINIEMHENVVEVRCLVGGGGRGVVVGGSHQGRWRLNESSGSPDKDPTVLNVLPPPATYREKECLAFYEGR